MSFAFGQPIASTTGSTAFNLGSATTTTTGVAGLGGSTLGGGFSFGAATAAPTATNAAVTTCLSLPQQQRTVRFDTPSTATSSTTAAPTLSLLLGASSGTTTQTGAAAATTAAPSSLGGLLFGTSSAAGATSGGLFHSAAPSIASSTGYAFGVPATTLGSGTTLGSTTLGGTTVGGTTFSSTLGGGTTLGGSTLLGNTTLGGATASSGSVGLGGVDPKVSGACGSTAGAVKTCDAKAVKETCVPPELLATVDEFTKHVKSQKCVRENIARMSSKPLFRIQEDVKNLRQQLLLVNGGLQRNAAAIEKLKRETTQELKHAEIALRTKETPAGLQYENTAPSDYFHHLADEFETQMQMYRQQIVETENHLASSDQSSTLSPQELSMLLNKLNEGFIALAAQLQVTHEAVKEQKEVYLNYRRTFYGDTTNVFDRCSTAQNTLFKPYRDVPSTVGPTPFSHMSNTAAVAMAAALNRTQPTSGTGMFGSSGGNTSTLAGSMLGSIGGQTSATTGLSLGGTFGSPATQQPFSLASSGFGSQPIGTVGTLTGGTASPFGTTPMFGATQQPTGGFGFALQKTPSGSKRGKNA